MRMYIFVQKTALYEGEKEKNFDGCYLSERSIILDAYSNTYSSRFQRCNSVNREDNNGDPSCRLKLL